MTTTVRPSKKQKELLQFIENFINGHGYGPSYREVMRGLNYKSVSTVASHIDNLIAKGHLTKKSHSARSLELTGAQYLETSQARIVDQEQSKWLVDLIKIKFDEAGDKPNQKELDDLYVLTGALKVLGLNQATESFKARLRNMS